MSVTAPDVRHVSATETPVCDRSAHAVATTSLGKRNLGESSSNTQKKMKTLGYVYVFATDPVRVPIDKDVELEELPFRDCKQYMLDTDWKMVEGAITKEMGKFELDEERGNF